MSSYKWKLLTSTLPVMLGVGLVAGTVATGGVSPVAAKAPQHTAAEPVQPAGKSHNPPAQPRPQGMQLACGACKPCGACDACKPCDPCAPCGPRRVL